MTVAVDDGDPPLPPEHMQHASCVTGTLGDQDESKHPDASFIISPKPPGTVSYGQNPVAKLNGRNDSDHDPPTTMPQTLPHRSSNPGRKQSEAFSLPPSLLTDDDKTVRTNATIPNGRYIIDLDPPTTTTSIRPPSMAPPDPTTNANTSMPLSLAPPPPRIDLAALKASILAMDPYLRSYHDDTTTAPTSQAPPERVDLDALRRSIFSWSPGPTTSTDTQHDNTLPQQTTPTTTTKPPPTTKKPKTTTTMQTNEKTEPTKKTLTFAPRHFTATASTLSNMTPLTQSTADAADDVDDDFPMMLPTTTPTTTQTIEKTEKPMLTAHRSHATDSTLLDLQLTTQSTADAVADVEDDFPMIMPKPMTTTTILPHPLTTTRPNHPIPDPKTNKPMTCHSKTTIHSHPVPPAPLESFDRAASTVYTLTTDGETKPLKTVQTYPSLPYQTAPKELPTPSPTATAQNHSPIPSLPPEKATTDPTNQPGTHPIHPDSPTSWLRDAFEPVFKALDRLANKIQGLHTAITETLTSCNASNLLTNLPPQSHHQNLDPQQTHHRHQNHRKHRHFLSPPLPIPHPNLSKRLPFSVNIRLPTYHRYLANNFQPP